MSQLKHKSEPCVNCNMTIEQINHMKDNAGAFYNSYCPKYEAGQKQHHGNMWEMGAYQALEQMEQEVLDQWSYCRQIRTVLGEIEAIAKEYEEIDKLDCGAGLSGRLLQILNRVKDDGIDEPIPYELTEDV